jgi:glycerophosphoryl diester phosphodiesterase
MGHVGYLGIESQFGIPHRGGAGENLENTISAFAHSVALGFLVIETDLQVTQDGELVISHDDRLLRNFGLRGAISSLNYRELAVLKQRNGDAILRLSDFLDWLPKHIRLNLDPKSDAVVKPLIAFLESRSDLWERVCLGSFETRRLSTIRAALPEVSTSLGSTELRDLILSARSGRSFQVPAGVIAVQSPEKAYGLRIINQKFIHFVHELGLDLHVWTIDSQPDMHRLLDLGVDALMTDLPTVLKSVLIERDQWRGSNAAF